MSRGRRRSPRKVQWHVAFFSKSINSTMRNNYPKKLSKGRHPHRLVHILFTAARVDACCPLWSNLSHKPGCCLRIVRGVVLRPLRVCVRWPCPWIAAVQGSAVKRSVVLAIFGAHALAACVLFCEHIECTVHSCAAGACTADPYSTHACSRLCLSTFHVDAKSVDTQRSLHTVAHPCVLPTRAQGLSLWKHCTPPFVRAGVRHYQRGHSEGMLRVPQRMLSSCKLVGVVTPPHDLLFQMW